MRFAIFVITVYLSFKITAPGSLKLLKEGRDSFKLANKVSYMQSSALQQFCMVPINYFPVDSHVIRMAGWLEVAENLKMTLLRNQLQFIKLFFALLVLFVPISTFRLSVALGLVTLKWFELGIDIGYGIDVIVMVSALILQGMNWGL